MSNSELDRIRSEKQALRKLAGLRLAAQPERTALSHQILARLESLECFQAAKCVMSYVSTRNEVQTKEALLPRWLDRKKVVVPYVENGELGLFWLERMDELVEGTWGILEPPESLRCERHKRPQPEELECIVVPGIAFDRQGGRLGYGKGYYDRLLQHVAPDAFLVAIAFESQIFDRIPCQSHDVKMDCVLTEHACYYNPASAHRIH